MTTIADLKRRALKVLNELGGGNMSRELLLDSMVISWPVRPARSDAQVALRQLESTGHVVGAADPSGLDDEPLYALTAKGVLALRTSG
jgi:hypothetical protein